MIPSPEAIRADIGEPGCAALRAEAEELVAGRVRLFGGEPAPLRLRVEEPLRHWTEYEEGIRSQGAGLPDERQVFQEEDIKFTWEAGRFGWAYTLGRAYLVWGEERYAKAFWEYAEAFLEANPPYLGPHWVSAQEVALRLMALVFAGQVFAGSEQTAAERSARLAEAVAAHARRIPPTLAYARAQNNNHLLSEAAGLYTAGLALPEHPEAKRWREIGWRWFHRGLLHQIDEDGSYTQQSTNYHRLMLQLALWVRAVAYQAGQPFPEASQVRLAAATRWLLALCDGHAGRAPNLGPNDGAYILPFTACPFQDYRPALQAAASVFLGERPFAEGAWDEMTLWLGEQEQDEIPHPDLITPNSYPLSPAILRNRQNDSWAYLRAARFHNRPGHADQLHLDLWWRGINLVQDAGTYLYNASPPWDNSLARTCAHNTLTVDGEDQMRRAGRFLWLDWAQAEVGAQERAEDGSWERLTAHYDGYRRFGVIHERAVTAFRDGRWMVEDTVETVKRGNVHTFRLHWLMPDWEWEVSENREARFENRESKIENRDSKIVIRMRSPHGWIGLEMWLQPVTPVTQWEGRLTKVDSRISNPESRTSGVQLIRAGELVYGSGEIDPTLGWVSPTYGVKVPALSLIVSAEASAPFTFFSEWKLP